ncbi:MAG: Gfo/Idh/MocA family oxidoreductase [Bryobacteraceae bacterium]|nr:Gfo/Idh/MocA family oxidoreductase [Bryobacteraceae bacterium]
MERDSASRRVFLKSSAAFGTAASYSRILGANDRLGLGFVGVGGRGTGVANTVVKLIAAGENVEITSVCDIYQPRLERAETRFKAKGYARSADMLSSTSLDAVVIATPDRHHVANTLEAIRAGKDVYVEKPICHWAQFDQLKQLVHENRKIGRIVQVGTQFVADSVWEKSAEAIKEGAIGKPVHAQTCYFRRGDQGERGMKIDDPNAKDGLGVDWETFQADAPRRPFNVSRLFQWRMYMDYSGGPITDTYPHMLTPLLKMLNPGFPKKVVALGGRYYYNHDREVPDTFDLLIQYPQDLTVVFLGTFINATRIDTLIRGSEATLTRKTEAVTIEPARGSAVPAREIPADIHSFGEGHAQQLVAHLKDFFECVRTRKQPRGNLELAYIVQTPLLMAMQAHLHEKVVYFDTAREEMRMV